MTTQEMRELDAWIAEHVMGWRSGRSGMQSRNDPSDDSWILSVLPYDAILKHGWIPTKKPENAMDVLKKCAEIEPSITISRWQSNWIIGSPQSSFDLIKSTTIELSICLLAKELFSRTTK